MYIFIEYIENELHFYLMQLKQMWTAEKFFLMGKESPYSRMLKLWCLLEAVNKTATTICAA